uniref:DNA polymerase alpha subunit B n=1 Tax=Gongylonema pulchrum TaxID=637853 RepID=A0A183EMP4_9BILA
LLVPSGKKDATVRPSFPTAPFRLSKERQRSVNKNIILLPDPAVVQIAGVEFAVSASEIIQRLGREQISCSGNKENEDRMTCLVNELFRQRSLYPLYPSSADISYRLSEAIKRCVLSRIPHFIILSSILAPVVKVVSGSVFVNPNVLARGSSGTFAKLNIDLNSIDKKSMVDSADSSVADFCEIHIVRL